MLRHVSSQCVSQRVYAGTNETRIKTRHFEVITKSPISGFTREQAAFKEAVRRFVERYALATGLTVTKPQDFTLTVKVKVTEEFTNPEAGEGQGYKPVISGGPFVELDKKISQLRNT